MYVMVNVLISTYNGEKFIEEQLNSINRQSFQNFHVYIRDDGSQDHTVEIIRRWIKNTENENRYTLLVEKNLGFCGSFFELLKLAETGDFWAFCDQDDIWYEKKLERAIEIIQPTDNNVPIAYHANFKLVNKDGKKIGYYHANKNKYSFRKSITSSICYGFAMVINRQMRDEVLKSNWHQIQSHDWYISMIAMGFGKLLFDDQEVAEHRMHESNNSPSTLLQKIKKGVGMISNTSIYTKNSREYYRSYKDQLSKENQIILGRFLNKRYSFIQSIYKACYPGRWNDKVSVEIMLRVLMLIGVI